MYLPPGFVVGGRYVVGELLSAGSKFRVYSAQSSEPNGAGEVAIKVARHDDVSSAAELAVGRARVAAEWRALMQLHEHATSAAPLPIELVHMYPGDPEVRRVALMDKSLVRSEPYMVCELADGIPLSVLLQRERLDEERALLISLRVLLLIRAARRVGVELTDFSASNFVVDAAGANVSVVGVTGKTIDVAWAGPTGEVPEGYGRLLASVLAGVAAPGWGGEEEDLPRWERLLETRRVPREFHSLILGALGYTESFDATVDAVENRLRGLARAPRPRVYDHPSKSQDAPYLIATGEQIYERFAVGKPLGQGGRGFVYRVRDERSDAEVLIKCNKYTYDSGSAFALELPTRRAELEHEYEVLKHFAAKTGMLPQPVALVRGRARGSWFDLAPGLAEGEPYLAMEFIKGIPLLDLLPKPYEGYGGAQVQGNRLDPRFVLRLVAQIADVLRRFHEEGFLYQDLKPENVLYDSRAENVYMVDFAGACPRVASGELDKHHVAFGVQTHGFAAPEFASLWERSDDRFDVYSLGATAYHLLTGVNPERVALEEGTEYPDLKLSLLDTVPPSVAELVARCLAPVDQRIASAAEVKKLAERARLLLSRTRPLDVLDLQVEYTTAGTRLHWRLPSDPRVTEIRVTRTVGDSDTVVLDGGMCAEFVDSERPEADTAYTVQTAYVRDGNNKHSRGREVRAEARPAPVLFEVTPYFGGNLVRCAVAPHASARIVRWSLESPPLEVTDGQALAPGEGDRWVHALPAGTTAFYAAFASYDDVVSAPRSGSAKALGAMSDPGEVTVLHSERGVGLRWTNVVDDARARVFAADGTASELIPAVGATEIWDTALPHDTRTRMELFIYRDGVASEPLGSFALHRWPAAPAIALMPSLGSVRMDVGQPLNPRFTALNVQVRVDGALVSQRLLDPEVLPAELEIPANVPVELRVVSMVEDAGAGPESFASVVVPSRQEVLRLQSQRDALPVVLSVAPSSDAAQWSGVFDLTWWRDDTELGKQTNTIAGLFASGGGPELEFVIEDDALSAGDEATYRVELCAPSGARVADAALPVRGVERLDAPEVTPLLGALRVEPLDDVERVELLVTVEDQSLVGPLVLPHTLSVPPGTSVSVAVRRAVEGPAMHWSPSTTEVALMRPAMPSGLRVAPVGASWRASWEPASDPSVDYVVRAFPGNRLVYMGADAEFVDAAVGATSYAIYARRAGLLSDPATAEVDCAVATTALQLRRSTDTHLAAMPPSKDALVRCVTVRGVTCAELQGPARVRLIAVVPAGGKDTLRAMRSADWLKAGRAVAVAVVSSRRPVVAWRGRGPVSVFEAPLEPGRPDWSEVARDVEPVRGSVVEAVPNSDGALELRAFGKPVPLEPGDALSVYPERGAATPVALVDGSGVALGEITRFGVGAQLPADVEAHGLGLAVANSPVVLVPACGAPSPLVALWNDTANGFPLWVALALEARWGAPLAARSAGNPGAFHFLKAGGHVEVTIGCVLENARGHARLTIRSASVHGRLERVFRCRLGSPRTYNKMVSMALDWLDGTVRGGNSDRMFRVA